MKKFGWNFFQNFSKEKKFYYQSNKLLIIRFHPIMSAVELVGVKIWSAHLKSLEIRMPKLVLDFSVALILPEKINKVFLPKMFGFIDVLSTVQWKFCNKIFCNGTLIILQEQGNIFQKHLLTIQYFVIFPSRKR